MEEYLGALFKGDWDAATLNEKLAIGPASTSAASTDKVEAAAAPEPGPMSAEPEVAQGSQDEGPSLRTVSVKKGALWKECGMNEWMNE